MNLEHAEWFFTRLDIIEFLMTQEVLRDKFERHTFLKEATGIGAPPYKWWWGRAEEAVCRMDRYS